MMYIARILYPVQNLGPGNRLGIWVSGCGRDCHGCANPELRIQKPEHKMSLGALARIIHMLPALPDAVTITGGEPFDQPEGLSELCRWLSANVSRDILVYSGYTLRQLRERKDSLTDLALMSISALIDGEYVAALNRGNQLKGSENQTLHVFRPQYADAYSRLDCPGGIRRIQPFLSHDGSIIATGFEENGFQPDFSSRLQRSINRGESNE